MKLKCALFLATLFTSTISYASGPLITDNETVSGKGNSQIELSGSYSYDRVDQTTNSAFSTNFAYTYGLTNQLDLIVGVPYRSIRSLDDNSTYKTNGLSDMSFELKYALYTGDNFYITLKPGFTLSTGNELNGLGEGKSNYSIYMITSKIMNPWSIHFSMGYILNDNSLNEREDIWNSSIALQYGITDNLKFVNNLGIERNRNKYTSEDPKFFLTGFIYSLSKTSEFGIGFKYGLNEADTDYTLLTGLTYKF